MVVAAGGRAGGRPGAQSVSGREKTIDFDTYFMLNMLMKKVRGRERSVGWSFSLFLHLNPHPTLPASRPLHPPQPHAEYEIGFKLFDTEGKGAITRPQFLRMLGVIMGAGYRYA